MRLLQHRERARRPSAALAAVLAAAGVAAVLALAQSACTSAPLVPPTEAGSPTQGLGMTIWFARAPSLQYQYFVVKSDGTMDYGGGMMALNRQTEWTGKIGAEQGKKVREIVDSAGWLTAEDPSKSAGSSPVAEMEFYADGRARTMTISGPDAKVQELVDALQVAANQRFENYMQRLPEAGVQRK